MAGENPSWGEGRIACEHSLKLGLLVEACSSTTIHASMNIFAIGASTKWYTLWTDTPTIELKCRISQPANGNGKWRRFKSARHAQRFLSLPDAVPNLFRVVRHLLRSSNHRLLQSQSFSVWRAATVA